jgi:A/G-specific adenine glycosylase
VIDVGGFQAAVLEWYAAEGRRLPFRGTSDPYLVMVSEAILQQTQVARGGPAWQAFTARFPTIETLAAATPADVLRAWRGLGYNRRAINLQRAARIVVDELGGCLPTNVAELERLPGIGPYTARAIASIAFGQPVGAVDTNVRRVIGRFVAGDATAFAARDLEAMADRLASVDRPAEWTHALIDLGATVCRPRDPRCGGCPVRSHCRYAREASHVQAARPGAASARRPATGRRLAVTGRSGAGRPGARPRSVPFEQSTRWLRGRIVDRLREVDGPGWAIFDGPLGGHDRAAVLDAVRTLASEGLAELDVDTALLPARTSLRARLPLV